MEKDTAFVPYRKSQAKTNPTILEKIIDHSAADTPIVSAASLIFHQVLGWPAYILMNAGAGPKSLAKSNRANSSAYRQSHLDPTADILTPSEAPFVALIAITCLHHTHEDDLHYEAEDWTFIKGAASSVDREFGFIGRHVFHGIIEYHVAHHLFPRIPFYHAEEATWAIAPLLELHEVK
ncbi:hypothetical protein E8E12_000317 [Didymella heteroderae]|uniref:Fatty acid desaturase domain-containing protein n=1 Tax=Didymella heteroderae TaxID=1769908 RepID=A0A9P5BVH6_9PLEO|nr:hypothetical protein E8E12_000317 [Didymella heteroderae]